MRPLNSIPVKPKVIFDVENRDHRRWAGEFLMTGSWKNCPVWFSVKSVGSPAIIISQQMLQHYCKKELSFMGVSL